MLIVQLVPCTVLAGQSRDWVTDVGHREPTVEHEGQQAGGTVRAALLAGDLEELLIELLKHYNNDAYERG